MDLDSKRMLDKEEEEGQTSRGSPVIGKCLHWQLYISTLYLQRGIFDVDFFTGASASNCDSGISDGSPGPQVENSLINYK